jgi:hypothetical protein
MTEVKLLSKISKDTLAHLVNRAAMLTPSEDGGSQKVSCARTVKKVPTGLTGMLFSGGVEGEVAFCKDLEAGCVLFGDLITVSGICGLPGGVPVGCC